MYPGFSVNSAILASLLALGLGPAKAPEVAPLTVDPSGRFLRDEYNRPLLWIGCTAWGMTEWLTREEVDDYLDDRVSKGINVVQICLFWGKRVDNPLSFSLNPANAYGHKAFVEDNGALVAAQPAVVPGGSPDEPNDYWDHVDYCLQAMKRRGMYAVVLPVWGRRYVNATHHGHSSPIFDESSLSAYGAFLGQRFGSYQNLVWTLGGDVRATAGEDHRQTYRAMARSIAAATDRSSRPLMTYHPDGNPESNSSRYFHHDEWLDFNMVQTFSAVEEVVAAIRADRALEPAKPTVLAEGDYEGKYSEESMGATALGVRQQSYQAFFAGAAGFTYGAAFDDDGNGPLFGPSNNWKSLLNLEGAGQMKWLRAFLLSSLWPEWQPSRDAIVEGRGSGRLEKLAVRNDAGLLIYFPDNSRCLIKSDTFQIAQWYNPSNGRTRREKVSKSNRYRPPEGWQDAVLILK